MGTLRIVFKKVRGEPLTNSEGESLLYFRYSHQNTMTYISSGVSIRPEHWDSDPGRGKEPGIRRGCPDRLRKEAALTRKRNDINNAIKKLDLQEIEPTAERVKAALMTGPKKSSFSDILDEFLNAKHSQSGLSEGSKTAIGSMVRTLKGIAGNGVFDDRTLKKIQSSIAHRRQSTISNYNVLLKSIAKFALADGYKIPQSVTSLKSKLIARSPVWFTPSEIMTIAKAETDRPDIAAMFCFQCMTGLRYSDLLRISKANLDGDFLNVTTQKRGTPARPPLIPEALELWKKYGYRFPKLDLREYNRGLKKVLEQAEFVGQIEVTLNESTGRRFVLVRRCDVVSSHSGPKSFISNCLNSGLTIAAVSQFVGKQAATILKHYSGPNTATAAEQYGRLFSGL